MTTPDSLDFHHIGVACEAIASELSTWAALGYRLEGPPFVDHEQGIRGQFLVGGGPRVELLEPVDESSTLTPWLKRRTKFYHLGYLTPTFDAAMAALVGGGATMVRPPVASAYFKGRIAFLMLPNLVLIELIDGGLDRDTSTLEDA